MEWFKGSIPEAINSSRSQKSILIVYITGTDDISKAMENTWNYGQVAKECRDGKCVALKLEANSESCQQFSQIYPVLLVPSTFFIGVDGTALEVIGGHTPPDQFSEKIKNVIQIHSEQVNSTNAPTESTPSTSSTDDVERTNRAREIIDGRRLQKAKEEDDANKRREIERRKLGKDLAELKKMKAERKAKELRDQIKKDKEEEKTAREKVKAQLAQDKAEKNARFQKEKEERESTRQADADAKSLKEREEKDKQARIASENARIQFRFPDGSSVNQTFLSDENLDKARLFVIEHTGGRISQFTLQMMYPKRQFTSEDMSQTFTELNLAPSAVLIVLPGKMKGSSHTKPDDGGRNVIGQFLFYIESFFLAIWGFIMALFWSKEETSQTQSSHQTRSSSDESKASTSRSDSIPYQRRPIRPGGRNVGRLTDDTDDKDKDTATWNGNSTQQL